MSIFGGTVNISEVTKASFLTSYIPKITGTAGTPTASTVKGQYIQIGKLVYVRYYIVISAAGGATSFFFSLPFPVDFAAASVDLGGTSPTFTNHLDGWSVGAATKFAVYTLNGSLSCPLDVTGTSIVQTGLYTVDGWYVKK